MARILIIDDEVSIRNMVITDIHMPEKNGLEAIIEPRQIAVEKVLGTRES